MEFFVLRRSYFADKPLPLVPKSFLPPVSDNIPRVLYEEKEMECQAKEETIQVCTNFRKNPHDFFSHSVNSPEGEISHKYLYP